jgi:broad specificity phosphatase PhoE
MEGGRRFFNEMARIGDENPGKCVLVTAHASVIRTFYAITLGTSPEMIASDVPFPSNASYSVAEFDGEKFTPREFSVDGHLASVGITKVDW